MKEGELKIQALGPQPQLSNAKNAATSSPAAPQPQPQPDPDPIKEDYLPGMQRRVGVVAGVAMVITSGVAAKVLNHAPEYEGKFQLALTTAQTTPQPSSPTNTSPVPQIQDVNQLIAPAPETQIKILKSHRFIDPTLQQLRSEISDLDYETLTQNLRIYVKPDYTLEVRYRDSDPQRVELVLAQLAQTYVQYSQECRDSVCRGITHIETQLPQVKQRITSIRQQIRQLRQQHNITNQDTQIKLFSARSAEIAKQRAEVEGNLVKAQTHYAELQQRMALSSKESIALSILSKDSAYLSALRQLRIIDVEIAEQLSRLDMDRDKLEELSMQYAEEQNKLYAAAQTALQRHLNNPQANLQDPVFQEPTYLNLIHQALSAVAYVQVLDHRQKILTQTEQQLQQQSDQIANLLRQYGEQQQQLQVETQSLQHYLDKLEELKMQTSPVVWKLAAEPYLKDQPIQEPAPIVQDLKRDVSSGAILGVVAGIGVAAALEQKNKWKPSKA
jgi:polysaccharide biosynthesis transport protein